MDRQDETLQGNEKIEVAIQALQKEATQEQLAHTLTVIRRRMKDSGQVIVAVEPSIGTTQMNLKMIQTSDGANWWYAFTSFNEEMAALPRLHIPVPLLQKVVQLKYIA